MRYGKVLVTLDGSQFAEAALQHALRIAEAGARIHLLSVVTEDPVSEVAALASSLAQPLAMFEGKFTPAAQAAHREMVQAREKYLTQISEWLHDQGYAVSVEVRPGNAVDQIIEVAREGFEVIVMASHGRTGLSRLALGSVAEGVLHKASCPVLIIPIRSAQAE
ncbi:MAG: universal stress protein [Anaerolinea sp.]|nr:universal stress protein [Anaerolinea sp.]MCC6973270.1 universal stress protein [Anaerolineae bacterium]CAG0958117.1 hypothetical protein ANRL4_00497 [Anaerolineae bacterium]